MSTPTDKQRAAFLKNAAAARALGAAEYTEGALTIKWDGLPPIPAPPRAEKPEPPFKPARPGRKPMVRDELDEALKARGLTLRDPNEQEN